MPHQQGQRLAGNTGQDPDRVESLGGVRAGQVRPERVDGLFIVVFYPGRPVLEVPERDSAIVTAQSEELSARMECDGTLAAKRLADRLDRNGVPELSSGSEPDIRPFSGACKGGPSVRAQCGLAEEATGKEGRTERLARGHFPEL